MKKGSFNIGLVSIVLVIVLMLAFIPLVLDFVSSADSEELECNAVATPILNTSFELCTNASGVHVVNASPTWSDGNLSNTETTILGIIPILFVVGLIVFVIGKFIKK